MMNFSVDMERVKNNFKELSELSIREGDGGYTRLAFSDQEKAVHQWLKDKLENLSCTVNQDSVGNLFGRYGSGHGPSIAFGSHLDTVPHGGLFDGALGVIAGLECLTQFSEKNINITHPLELICFTGEETNPLGGTFGSRAMAGLLERSDAYEKRLHECSFSWADVEASRKTKSDFIHFLELHIEQGSVLETVQKKIGVPNAIAGMLRLVVKLHGKAAHAGTTPMNLREDALIAAADLIKRVNQIALESDGSLVATVGEIHVSPNVPSVVPGEVCLIVEIRGIDWTSVQSAGQSVIGWLKSQSGNTEIKKLVEKYPCKLSDQLQDEIAKYCSENHITFYRMFSGANHDSNAMSTLCDTGMIFVPSKDGISHHPDEFTSWDDVEIGINTLIGTINGLCTRGKTN